MNKIKSDEWYTSRQDVEFQINLCKDKIKGKKVYLPCDCYKYSEYFKVLKEKFNELGLSTLEAFDIEGNYARYDGKKISVKKNGWRLLF